MKVRLDKALVARGLAGSRERAQALILAGRVMVAGQKAEKAGLPVPEGAELRLLGEDLRYVSRGGLKLEGAIRHWGIVLGGRTCVDVGASTGGFTDCMLQHGAAGVLAIDTGYGQIAHSLRVDARVRLMERCNARKLAVGELAGLRSEIKNKYSGTTDEDSGTTDEDSGTNEQGLPQSRLWQWMSRLSPQRWCCRPLWGRSRGRASGGAERPWCW